MTLCDLRVCRPYINASISSTESPVYNEIFSGDRPSLSITFAMVLIFSGRKSLSSIFRMSRFCMTYLNAQSHRRYRYSEDRIDFTIISFSSAKVLEYKNGLVEHKTLLRRVHGLEDIMCHRRLKLLASTSANNRPYCNIETHRKVFLAPGGFVIITTRVQNYYL